MSFQVGDICVVTNEGAARQDWLSEEIGTKVRIVSDHGNYVFAEKLDGSKFKKYGLGSPVDIWVDNLALAPILRCAECDQELYEIDYLCKDCRS